MGWLEEQKEKADKVDKEHFKDESGIPGMQMNRKCTDPLMCCLFMVWIIVMFYISIFAFQNGSVYTISYKYDMEGNDCSFNTNGYNKKLFTRLLPRTEPTLMMDVNAKVLSVGNVLYKHYSVCVKECPKKGEAVKYKENSFYVANHPELKTWDYNCEDLMGYCLPERDLIKDIADKIFKEMSEQLGSFSRYMNDIIIGWPIIVIMALISLFITVLYMYLLKWITKPILYTSLLLIFLFGILVTAWCYKKSQEYPKGSEDQKHSIAYACIAGILTVLYVVFLCCQWKNIRIGAEIMGCAGEFVATNPQTIVAPFVVYFMMVPIVIWFTFTNVYLYATGTPKFEDKNMFAKIEGTEKAYWMFWAFLFGFFWIMAFMIAVMQFATAATCALWYFTAQQSDAPFQVSIRRSLMWAIRYHPGSLAFGGLLIAITTMIKVVFEYFAKQQEKLAGQNPIFKCLTCCVRGMIWCLDTCVKFISENAYVQVAILSCSFCKGAHGAFYMMVRHPGTYTATSIAGWIMSAIGKALIMGFSVYISILMADAHAMTGGESIQQPFVVAFVVFLISWCVAAFFISLFDFACLTILQCFLISKELKIDGGKIWAPKSLQQFLKQQGEPVDETADKPKGNQVQVVVQTGTIDPHDAAMQQTQQAAVNAGNEMK